MPIDEFGEVGLDHLLAGALEREPVLLASGCLCCTISGDLGRAIRDRPADARRWRAELVSAEQAGSAEHAVQHVIHAPEHLPAWPAGDRRSRLVFIVEGLDPDAIDRSFRSVMRLASRLLPASGGDAASPRPAGIPPGQDGDDEERPAVLAQHVEPRR